MKDSEAQPDPAQRLAEQESWLLRRARRELGPHLRSELDSADLAQQARLELLRHPSRVQWREPKALRGWLGRVVANLAGQAGRRRRVAPRGGPSSGAGGPSSGAGGYSSGDPLTRLAGTCPTGSQAAQLAEGSQRLRDRLAGLPATTRRVIELRFWEDCSHAEIAERMSMTPESARVHLHRGLERLRDSQSFAREFSRDS